MSQEQRPEVQVLIPYKQLEELLQAGIELKAVRQELKRLKDQVAALRGRQYEIMLKLSDKD